MWVCGWPGSAYWGVQPGFAAPGTGLIRAGRGPFLGVAKSFLVRRKVSGERIGAREPGYRQKGPLGQGPFCKKVWEKRLLGANGRFSRANLLFEGGNGRGREAEDIF